MDDKSTAPQLRIATYNIRKTKGLDRRFDPRRTLSVINAVGADVIALQEVDHRLGQRPTALARDLIAQETDFEVVPFARNDVSLGWHGNAILVRKGYNVGGISHVNLPGLEPRGAIRLDLVHPHKITVVATHLGLMRRHRRRQLSAIFQHVDHDAPTIILGDFNEWSAKRGLEPLTGKFAVHSPGRTFHAARPIAGLDRIALSADLRLLDAGVVEHAAARRASDHLPIWADVAC